MGWLKLLVVAVLLSVGLMTKAQDTILLRDHTLIVGKIKKQRENALVISVFDGFRYNQTVFYSSISRIKIEGREAIELSPIGKQDTLCLKDGRIITGEIYEVRDGYTQISTPSKGELKTIRINTISIDRSTYSKVIISPKTPIVPQKENRFPVRSGIYFESLLAINYSEINDWPKNKARSSGSTSTEYEVNKPWSGSGYSFGYILDVPFHSQLAFRVAPGLSFVNHKIEYSATSYKDARISYYYGSSKAKYQVSGKMLNLPTTLQLNGSNAGRFNWSFGFGCLTSVRMAKSKVKGEEEFVTIKNTSSPSGTESETITGTLIDNRIDTRIRSGFSILFSLEAGMKLNKQELKLGVMGYIGTSVMMEDPFAKTNSLSLRLSYMFN